MSYSRLDDVPTPTLCFMIGRYLAVAEVLATSTGGNPDQAATLHACAAAACAAIFRRGVTPNLVTLPAEVDRIGTLLRASPGGFYTVDIGAWAHYADDVLVDANHLDA